MAEDRVVRRSDILSAGEIAISRGPGAGVMLRVRGGEEHTNVRIINPLPLGEGLRFACFADSKGKDLGMVRVDETLGAEARAIIEEEIARRYVCAMIERIVSIRVEGNVSYWDVETDRGAREFVLTSIAENVRRPSPRRVMISDACENRFEIPNVGGLDARSRKLLDGIL